jgi:hypothetical protein
LLQLTKDDYYYTSLFSSHNDKHETYCADTCNAVPGIMIEMLVCSSPGILELLPALPAALTHGSISGVKGRNRATVEDLRWDMGNHSVTCMLKSDIDQDITLIERDGIESISTTTGKTASPLGEIARVIQLKAGESTSLTLGLGQLRQAEFETDARSSRSSLALHCPVTVSSVADECSGANAVDGDDGTRWSSAYNDDEWIYVDLGAVKKLSGVKLNWEAAYGKSYKIQVSDDANAWTDVYSTTGGNGGIEQINFNANGRYVRMLGLERGTTFGYSLWEFKVYGD